MKTKERYIVLLLITPAIILIGLLNVYPIFFGITMSFERRAPGDVVGEWVGYANYVRLVRDPDFYDALMKGLTFSVGSVFLQVLAGLTIALVARESFRGRTFVRALIIVPYLIPTISVALIMKWIFNDMYGLANYALKSLGVIKEYTSFFGYPSTSMPTLIAANSWQFGMFATMIFLARLSSINPLLYEAAAVMGASAWRRFKDITFPSIRGVLFLVILLRSIWMFNKFDIIYLLTRGGPMKSTATIPIYTYIKAFQQYQIGFGATVCTIAFVILVIFSIIYFVAFKPEKEIAV